MLVILFLLPDKDQGQYMHTLATSTELVVPGWWRLGDVKTWELQGFLKFPSWPENKSDEAELIIS